MATTLLKIEGLSSITVNNNFKNYVDYLINNNLWSAICEKFLNGGTAFLHSFYTFIPQSSNIKFIFNEDNFQRTYIYLNNLQNPFNGVITKTSQLNMSSIISYNNTSAVDNGGSPGGLTASLGYSSSYWPLLSDLQNSNNRFVYYNNVLVPGVSGTYDGIVFHNFSQYTSGGDYIRYGTNTNLDLFGNNGSNPTGTINLKYLVSVPNDFSSNIIKFNIYETFILCACDKTSYLGSKYSIITTKIADSTTNWTICS